MGAGVSTSAPALKTYTEIFEAKFPEYLVRGMTYELYWESDPSLVIAYREADYLRQERANEQAWLQGYYVYEALCSVSPLLHAFAKTGTKARPYRDKPLELQRPKTKDAPPSPADMRKMESGKAAMRGYMAEFNKKFKKGVGEDAERGRSGASNPG